MALTDKLTSIADAIRTKNGTSEKLSLDDMASSILAIESGLVMKSGTTTSSTIETGLSSIKMIVIYTDSFSSTGFIQGTYVADEGRIHYTYCSSYSSYVRNFGVTSSTSCTVDGGTFTLNTSHGLMSDKTYNWIAVGEA